MLPPAPTPSLAGIGHGSRSSAAVRCAWSGRSGRRPRRAGGAWRGREASCRQDRPRPRAGRVAGKTIFGNILPVGVARLPWCSVSLTLGIVGLPNVGKSTLFNALTRNDVLAANYPFATIEPNVGVVAAARRAPRRAGGDLRLARRSCPPRCRSSTSPASSRAPPRARGWATSSWPTSASPTRSARSCACSTTRTSCTSTAGSTRPTDIETITTELILADLQTLEKAVPRLEKEARMQKDRAPGAGGGGGRGRDPRRRADAVRRRRRPRAAARAVAADHQAVPLRLQRRRGRAHRRGPAQGARRRWSPRPTPSSSTRRSSPSCWSWTRSRPRELLESIGQPEPGLYALARVGFHTLGPADLPDRGPEGVAGLDDPEGRDGARRPPG